jgi:gamma-glutamyltranspeptidase/glutathione hydrolase
MTSDGIILNDEMDDFSSPGQTNAFGFSASPANYIRPGKRECLLPLMKIIFVDISSSSGPQSSIASSIAEDLHTGEFVIAAGAAGGSRIITATLQNLHHHLDQGLSAVETEHFPRWHDQLTNVTYFEVASPQVGVAGINNDTVAYLTAKGYNATYQDTTGSTGHVIVRSKEGVFEAASDPRKPAGKAFAY